MNPYPLVGLNHFTVPVAIVRLLALCARVSHRAYRPLLSPRVLGNDLRAAQTRELSKADRKPGTLGCTIGVEMGQCCWHAGAVPSDAQGMSLPMLPLLVPLRPSNPAESDAAVWKSALSR